MARMLGRAGTTCPWDDGRKDREWNQLKRRQRRIEQRELVAELAESLAQMRGGLIPYQDEESWWHTAADRAELHDSHRDQFPEMHQAFCSICAGRVLP